MLNDFIKKFKEIDKKILKVISCGLKFCLSLAVISCFILLTYHYNLKSPDLFYYGLLLFKSSLFFVVDFIVCGFTFDTIRKGVT